MDFFSAHEHEELPFPEVTRGGHAIDRAAMQRAFEALVTRFRSIARTAPICEHTCLALPHIHDTAKALNGYALAVNTHGRLYAIASAKGAVTQMKSAIRTCAVEIPSLDSSGCGGCSSCDSRRICPIERGACEVSNILVSLMRHLTPVKHRHVAMVD